MRSFLIGINISALLLGVNLAQGQVMQASQVVSKYRNIFLTPPSHIPSDVAVDAPLSLLLEW